ncbi:MAG: hypothetical protein LBR74_00005, partial [Eubacterium sp.]|nr:hypothetical protein [Eubacterium sp.]
MAGDFTPVNIDSFKTGIILNCPVYSSKDLDDLHFIGEGLALTETIKEKLKKIALRSNIIYIPR